MAVELIEEFFVGGDRREPSREVAFEPRQGAKKQEFPIRDTKVSQLPKEILDFEKNQEIDKSTNWFKKTKVFSKNKFFFLLQKTRFLFFSTRIESQISVPASYCGPGCVQNSETLKDRDRVSGINSFFGFFFERFISDWFSKKIFIKSSFNIINTNGKG